MDSQVLRLIRRYDPVVPTSTGNKSRPSLENVRTQWHSFATNPSELIEPPPSFSSPLLSRRALTTNFEDEISSKSTATPRLQRQQAIQEQDSSSNKSLRPILKYASPRSRAELTVQPHKTEPLSVEIESHLSSIPMESPATYQPLITAANKRVCSALSKSEWDLRLQQDLLVAPPVVPPLPFPVRPPSPPLDRSKSSLVINTTVKPPENNNDNDDADDFDQMSAPIISNSSGNCVAKLKEILARKSSIDIDDGQQSMILSPSSSTSLMVKSPAAPIEPPPRTISKNGFAKNPLIKSQTTIESPESISRAMPTSELSYDAYRFQRSVDIDPMLSIRPAKNVAKVEPYSFNSPNNRIEPTTSSTSIAAPPSTTTTTTTMPTKVSSSSINEKINPMNNQQQQTYHYRASSTHPISYTSSSYSRPMTSETPMRSTLIHQPDLSTLDQQQNQQQNRRRFQKRKQMKRSKSVDLYQDISNIQQPIFNPIDSNKISRNQRSISREFLTLGNANESSLSSSSSTSSIGDIERVNQAVLLRHKSLDSMTFQRRTNSKDQHRRALSKPIQYDFDSDDSVCGIPKPQRVTTGR